MHLLKFFLEWGKHGLGFFWVVYAGLSIWFLYQAYVGYKSGWYRIDKQGVRTEGQRLKWYEYHKFSIFFLGITLAAIIIHFGIKYEWFD